MPQSEHPISTAFLTMNDDPNTRVALEVNVPLYLRNQQSRVLDEEWGVSISDYGTRAGLSFAPLGSKVSLDYIDRTDTPQHYQIDTEDLDTRVTVKGDGEIWGEGNPGFILNAVKKEDRSSVRGSDSSTVRQGA